MFCKFCKKDQEYIRVGGKTHCASCGGVLEDTGTTTNIKTPQIEPNQETIETEVLPHIETVIQDDVKEMAQKIEIPAKTKEELGGSAILLDILSDEAKDLKNEETLKKNEDLIGASGSAIDYLATVTDASLQDSKPKTINDISPTRVVKRDDYLDKYFKGAVKKVEDEVVKDIRNVEETVGSQKGSTKESTTVEIGILIVLIGVAVTALIALASYFI